MVDLKCSASNCRKSAFQPVARTESSSKLSNSLFIIVVGCMISILIPDIRSKIFAFLMLGFFVSVYTSRYIILVIIPEILLYVILHRVFPIRELSEKQWRLRRGSKWGQVHLFSSIRVGHAGKWFTLSSTSY